MGPLVFPRPGVYILGKGGTHCELDCPYRAGIVAFGGAYHIGGSRRAPVVVVAVVSYVVYFAWYGSGYYVGG